MLYILKSIDSQRFQCSRTRGDEKEMSCAGADSAALPPSNLLMMCPEMQALLASGLRVVSLVSDGEQQTWQTL